MYSLAMVLDTKRFWRDHFPNTESPWDIELIDAEGWKLRERVDAYIRHKITNKLSRPPSATFIPNLVMTFGDGEELRKYLVKLDPEESIA